MLAEADHPFWELFSSMPNGYLRWLIMISFTRLTLNRICSIVWLLIMLRELKLMVEKLEQMQKR